MKSGTPRKSASVLRSIGHSATLALVRCRDIVLPSRKPESARQVPLLWKAIGVGIVCAIFAFLYSWVNGSVPHRRSVVAAHASQLRTVNQARSTSATKVPILVPERHNEPETAFVLSPSPDFQHIGPVSIKLRAVHPDRKSCDFTLKISNGREWNQLEVKVNRPIPLVRGRRSTQLVVKEIFANSVSAYISEVRKGGA